MGDSLDSFLFGGLLDVEFGLFGVRNLFALEGEFLIALAVEEILFEDLVDFLFDGLVLVLALVSRLVFLVQPLFFGLLFNSGNLLAELASCNISLAFVSDFAIGFP